MTNNMPTLRERLIRAKAEILYSNHKGCNVMFGYSFMEYLRFKMMLAVKASNTIVDSCAPKHRIPTYPKGRRD